MTTTYRVPCSVCSVIVQSATYVGAVFCGPACESLHARRKSAEAAALPFTNPERHAITPHQVAMQRNAHRRRSR